MYTLPQQISKTLKTLSEGGFEAYVVGGAVRDLTREVKPRDWDIATNANPDEIIALFPKTVYENAFGTVTVVYEDEEDQSLREIQITPYRIEGDYGDARHPNNVQFTKSIGEDLARRDFSINALAYSAEGELIDHHEGIKDIKDKIVRTVGDPEERFAEDALRMLRAVRFAVEFGYTISRETAEAIHKNASAISKISMERIRDEFEKILLSPLPMQGMVLMNKLALLSHIMPESEEGIGVKQNGDHLYDVWEHTLRALQHAADRDFSLPVRLAVLLHDVGKPRTRNWDKEKGDYTFYGHDVVGARMTKVALERLRFSREIVGSVVRLVRNHMFFTDVDQITLSAVRRMVRNVGEERIWELMQVRNCDRIGMGRPKESPYRLRKYESMIEEALRSPTSVKMLKIDGLRLMDVTRESAGPRLGWILNALLNEVLDDPLKNTEEYLEKRAQELVQLGDKELQQKGEEGKEKTKEIEEEELGKIRKKYGVK